MPYEQELLDAINARQVDKVGHYISLGADVNHGIDNKLGEPLCYAVSNQNREIIDLLINAGAKLGVKGSCSATLAAVLKNDAKILEYLIQLHIKQQILFDPDDVDSSLMYFAVYHNAKECIEILLRYGAHPNIVIYKSNDYRLIHLAAEKNHLEVIDILIKAKVSVTCKDRFNYTPLYYAALRGHLETVNKLISFEEVNERNILEDSAKIAEENNHHDIAKLLRDHAEKLVRTPLYSDNTLEQIKLTHVQITSKNQFIYNKSFNVVSFDNGYYLQVYLVSKKIVNYDRENSRWHGQLFNKKNEIIGAEIIFEENYEFSKVIALADFRFVLLGHIYGSSNIPYGLHFFDLTVSPSQVILNTREHEPLKEKIGIPDIIKLTDNSFVVAWASGLDGLVDIEYQYFDVLGRKVGEPKFLISLDEEKRFIPVTTEIKLSTSDKNNFSISWLEYKNLNSPRSNTRNLICHQFTKAQNCKIWQAQEKQLKFTELSLEESGRYQVFNFKNGNVLALCRDNKLNSLQFQLYDFVNHEEFISVKNVDLSSDHCIAYDAILLPNDNLVLFRLSNVKIYLDIYDNNFITIYSESIQFSENLDVFSPKFLFSFINENLIINFEKIDSSSRSTLHEYILNIKNIDLFNQLPSEGTAKNLSSNAASLDSDNIEIESRLNDLNKTNTEQANLIADLKRNSTNLEKQSKEKIKNLEEEIEKLKSNIIFLQKSNQSFESSIAVVDPTPSVDPLSISELLIQEILAGNLLYDKDQTVPELSLNGLVIRHWRAIHLACYFGLEESIENLLDLQISLSPSIEGYTPLHSLALSNIEEEVKIRLATQLISLGLTFDAQTYNGDTALMLAAEKGDSDFSLYLIGIGADLFIQNNQDQSAVEKAKIAGYQTLSDSIRLYKQEFINLKPLMPTIWPTDYDYVMLSEHVYEPIRVNQAVKWLREDGKVMELPDWHVYKIYNNPKSSYFGALYLNAKSGHMALIHRGTQLESWFDLLYTENDIKADWEGIISGKFTAQMQDVINATNDAVLNEAIKHGYKFSTAGHSLGAWEAFLTALYCAHKLLIKNSRSYYRYIHAVLFDAPGLSRLRELVQKNLNQFSDDDIRLLDLRIYQSLPNAVNTLGNHLNLVKMFRLYPDIPHWNVLDILRIIKLERHRDLIYALQGHRLYYLTDQFNVTTGVPNKISYVESWPVVSTTHKTGITRTINYLLPSIISAGIGGIGLLLGRRYFPSRFYIQAAAFAMSTTIIPTLNFLFPSQKLSQLYDQNFLGFLFKFAIYDVDSTQLRAFYEANANPLEYPAEWPLVTRYSDLPYDPITTCLLTEEINVLLNILEKITETFGPSDQYYLLRHTIGYEKTAIHLTLKTDIILTFDHFIRLAKLAVVTYLRNPNSHQNKINDVNDAIRQAKEKYQKNFGLGVLDLWDQNLIQPIDYAEPLVQTSAAGRNKPWLSLLIASVDSINHYLTQTIGTVFDHSEHLDADSSTQSEQPSHMLLPLSPYNVDFASNFMLSFTVWHMARSTCTTIKQWFSNNATIQPNLASSDEIARSQLKLAELRKLAETKPHYQKRAYLRWLLLDLADDLTRVSTKEAWLAWRDDYKHALKVIKNLPNKIHYVSNDKQEFFQANTTICKNDLTIETLVRPLQLTQPNFYLT